VVVFFFSSRRRHTRFKCDWSSDVCSSDLQGLARAHDRFAGVIAHALAPVLDGFGLALAAPGPLALALAGRLCFVGRHRRIHCDRSEERRVGEECGWGWWTGDMEVSTRQAR